MVDAQLWETNPEKAAKLAFLELQMLWETQVDEGQYLGIPCFDQSPTNDHPAYRTPVTPDSKAGFHCVPTAVSNAFQRVRG
jgi:hypothetical protein